MASQVQKEKTETKQAEVPQEPKPADLKAKGDELKSKADDIVDLIDDILEENAEQFIKSYVQRGGE